MTGKILIILGAALVVIGAAGAVGAIPSASALAGAAAGGYRDRTARLPLLLPPDNHDPGEPGAHIGVAAAVAAVIMWNLMRLIGQVLKVL